MTRVKFLHELEINANEILISFLNRKLYGNVYSYSIK